MEINKIIHGDSLEYMKSLPDKCIDLVLTDPPYFGVVKNDWDNQWKTQQEFINWLEEYTKEWKRVLKDNGSLYIFGDDKIIAYVQVMMDKYFKLENSIVWSKGTGYLTCKGWDCFRSYAPITERLLFYSNEIVTTGLQFIEKEYIAPRNPFAKELRKAREKKGVSINQVAEYGKFYGNVNHGGVVTNWELGYNVPSKEQWAILCDNLPIERKEYEELRKEYEELRRPFNPTENFTDVWTFPITSEKEKWAGKHPTIKPLAVIKRIIETSSRPGDIILDCFAGSGTTAVACIETGRNYIVIEKEKDYVDIIHKRVRNTTPPLFIN